MNLRLIVTLPIGDLVSPAHLKSMLAPIVPAPIPEDLTLEFIPPSSLRISYTQSYTDVTDAAEALYTLIIETWPNWINVYRKHPLEP
ncbi:hypothetical protein ES703_25781 [subsurface metagenome]